MAMGMDFAGEICNVRRIIVASLMSTKEWLCCCVSQLYVSSAFLAAALRESEGEEVDTNGEAKEQATHPMKPVLFDLARRVNEVPKQEASHQK
jgi:hypothetical protein